MMLGSSFDSYFGFRLEKLMLAGFRISMNALHEETTSSAVLYCQSKRAGISTPTRVLITAYSYT